MTDVALV